jgi:hypothetical protein
MMKERSGMTLTKQEIIECCVKYHGSVESALKHWEVVEAQNKVAIEKAFCYDIIIS